MRNKVEVVTAWYNEEILAPYFLHHYGWADRIHILLDNDTSDKSRVMAMGHSKVIIHPISYPNGIDWEVKSRKVNDIALSCKSDWVIAVDADEFIWPITNEETAAWLSKQPGNVVFAAMWSVYRHESESDLDPDHPSVYHRRHGCQEAGMTYGMAGWVKPCVAKPETAIEWSCGIHSYKDSSGIVPNDSFMIGTHWAMADQTIALSRRLGQRNRQSANNIRLNHGYQNFTITKEEIEDDCRRHERDPQLF